MFFDHWKGAFALLSWLVFGVYVVLKDPADLVIFAAFSTFAALTSSAYAALRIERIAVFRFTLTGEQLEALYNTLPSEKPEKGWGRWWKLAGLDAHVYHPLLRAGLPPRDVLRVIIKNGPRALLEPRDGYKPRNFGEKCNEALLRWIESYYKGRVR